MEKDKKLIHRHSLTVLKKEQPTRLTVIGKDGIIYSNHNCEFELSWQDNNKTLKIFIK